MDRVSATTMLYLPRQALVAPLYNVPLKSRATFRRFVTEKQEQSTFSET
jgi:hypothetical protein